MPSVRDLTIADRRGTVGVLASSCTTTTARTAPSAAAPPPSGSKSSRRRSPPPRPSTPPTTRAGSLSARRTPATAGSQPPRVWHDQRRPYITGLGQPEGWGSDDGHGLVDATSSGCPTVPACPAPSPP